MAIRFYSAFLILLSLAASCLSDPVQNPDTVFKRQTGGDGDQEATKNNTISLNEQLANLTETVKKLQYILNTAKDTTMAQLSSLQSSVKTLTTRVNSPVNLYQNCIEETRSCDVTVPDTQDDTTNIYVESCDTPPLPINREGFYTIEMRCGFEQSQFFYLVSTQLRTNNGQVQCQCEVTHLNRQSPQHNPLAPGVIFTITLNVTRCPQSQTIVN